MTEQLINTLKSTADFLQGIYADPSVTLRVREASRIKENELRQLLAEFENTTSAKPAKKTTKKSVYDPENVVATVNGEVIEPTTLPTSDEEQE